MTDTPQRAPKAMEKTDQLPGIPYPADALPVIWTNPRMIQASDPVPDGWRVVMTYDYGGIFMAVIVSNHHPVSWPLVLRMEADKLIDQDQELSVVLRDAAGEVRRMEIALKIAEHRHQVGQARSTKLLSEPIYEALLRAAEHVRRMWSRRYDTDTDQIPDSDQGVPFGCPVAVDLGDLAVVQSELNMALALMKHMEKKP